MQVPTWRHYVQWAVWILSSAMGPHVSFWRTTLCSSISLIWVISMGIPLANNATECSPVPPMEDSPGYKRQPVQTPYPPLLGVLTRVILKFQEVSVALGFHTIPQSPPNLSHLSLHSSPSSLHFTADPSCSCPQSACKSCSIHTHTHTRFDYCSNCFSKVTEELNVCRVCGP